MEGTLNLVVHCVGTGLLVKNETNALRVQSMVHVIKPLGILQVKKAHHNSLTL